jgi:hypothetical protein
MPKKFHKIEKAKIGRVPVPIADAIRMRAFRERRSIESVLTEILCRGMGINPSRFGLDPEPQTQEIVKVNQ